MSIKHRLKKIVELTGVEPVSKRGNHTLSTCLSSPLIFEKKQDRSHQLFPYPLKLYQSIKAYFDYPLFSYTAKPDA